MRGPLARFTRPTEVPVVEEKPRLDNDKEIGVVDNQPRSSDGDSDADAIDSNAQAGVKKIEATTKVWTRSSLIMAYVL